MAAKRKSRSKKTITGKKDTNKIGKGKTGMFKAPSKGSGLYDYMVPEKKEKSVGMFENPSKGSGLYDYMVPKKKLEKI